MEQPTLKILHDNKGFIGKAVEDMKLVTRLSIVLSLLSLLSMLSGCNNSSSGSPNAANSVIGPKVVSIYPASDDLDVPLNSKVNIKFNEPLNPTSVTSDALLLLAGSNTSGQPVVGSVDYSESNNEYIVTFTPNADLAPAKVYTVILTNVIMDLDSNRAAYFDYSFTTVGKDINDTISPEVSSTVPYNGETKVAVNRSIVVNFNELMDPASIDGNSFYLTRTNSTTKVTGTIHYVNGSASFTPASDLQANASYRATVTTAVTDVAGNSMATNYQWTFTTDAANNGDTTPPGVTVVTPGQNTANVAVNTSISAGFNEALKSSSVNSSSFTLKANGANVAGTVSYSGTTAVFAPTSSLATNTTYTATLTTAIQDLAGNALAADYSWSFTTEAAANTDTTPPMVTAVSPLVGAADVATNASISAQFSEALDPATVNSATFILKDGAGALVEASVNYNGVSATLTPLAGLQGATFYTATLTAGITDLAGNTLSANYAWSFTTINSADTTPPTVVSTNPADAAIDVFTNMEISAQFSESLNPGTVNTSTFLLNKQSDGSVVSGVVNYSAVTAIFTPLISLETNTIYIATLTTGISDLAGNSMTTDVTWTFTTAANADTTPPTLAQVAGALSPPRGATGVPIATSAISATFSEALDPNTVTSASVSLSRNGILVAGTVTYANNTITFSPSGLLAFASTYTATITTAVTDLAGNHLLQNIVWSFSTLNPGGMGGGGGGG